MDELRNWLSIKLSGLDFATIGADIEYRFSNALAWYEQAAQLPSKTAPAPSSSLTDTEKGIVGLVSGQPLKGQIIAQRLSLDYDYTRRLLAKLVRAGLLINNDKGYLKTM